MTRKLDDLVARGVNPSRQGWQSLLLENYQQILNARGLLWTWKDIAEALDIPEEKKGDLSKAFRRIDAGLKSGRFVKPIGGTTKPVSSLRVGTVVKNGDADDTEQKNSRIKYIGPK